MKEIPATRRLAEFLSRYSPEVRTVARAALAKMRARLPGSIELVYDNYNALAIGFGPTERPSEAIFSIAVYPRWVSLFFLHGAELSDPDRVLRGGGKKARHVVLETAAVLDSRPIRALIGQALASAAKRPDARIPGRIVMKSVSARQRPRRPPDRTVRRRG